MGRAATSYPGDELVPDPSDVTHHSIIIDARPEDVWPWVVQVGYHRAGWYIDTWWDAAIQRYFWPAIVPKNARGTYQPPLTHIDPDLQHLHVGDIVPDGPEGSAFFTVEILDEPRALGLLSKTHIKYLTPRFLWGTRVATTGDFSWVFLVDPVDDAHTRLTLRMRARVRPAALGLLFKPALHLTDRLHVRHMLLGFKRRVENPNL